MPFPLAREEERADEGVLFAAAGRGEQEGVEKLTVVTAAAPLLGRARARATPRIGRRVEMGRERWPCTDVV